MTEARSVLSSRTARLVGQAVLVLAVGYVVYGQVSTQIEANEAESTATEAAQGEREAQRQAKSLAELVAEACAQGGPAAAELGSACEQAREIQREPVAPPRDGVDGKDGRGIASTVIADGRLLVTYTDGVVEDKGAVVGADGKPGEDGRSIRSSTVADGALVLSYSDGSSEVAGVVVGRDGVDGRGIAGVTVSADYRLVVSYTDGTTADVGPLPPGPQGDPGRGIESVEFDMDACAATVHYTDGSSEPAPMTGCDPDPDPSDPADPPGGLLPGGN